MELLPGTRVFSVANYAPEEVLMMGWAITFLIVAIIAALLGFGGIAGVAVEAAKLVFFVALILFLISAVVHVVRGRRPVS